MNGFIMTILIGWVAAILVMGMTISIFGIDLPGTEAGVLLFAIGLSGMILGLVIGHKVASDDFKSTSDDWVEWGDGPPKRGDYRIKIESHDGVDHNVITAWYNPCNGHWLIDGVQCGFANAITPTDSGEEWRITNWKRGTK